MGGIKELLQSVFTKKTFIQNIEPKTKKGDIDMSGSTYIKEVHKHYYGEDSSDNGDYLTIDESIKSVDLKEVIIPIETLISQGKYPLAIQKYEELINSPQFHNYSKNERFLVYNGLLNCYINADASNEIIEKWSQKIQALGNDVDEIQRYYFLMGIREYNQHKYDNALIYLGQSIKADSDYIKAITAEILVKQTKGDISYEEATTVLDKLLSRKGLSIKEYASIHSRYSDVAFNSRDYKIAQNHYIKSNELSSTLSKEIGIAVCQYLLSLLKVKEDGRVELIDIDFKSLSKAEEMFCKIYEARNEHTVQTIINLSISFYFNILALIDKHDRILEVYNESKQYFGKSMIEPIQYVVEAQVLNGEFDKELVSNLDEFNQIKFEAFYYEKNGEYDKVIEFLTPIFESEYKNEKVLQLTFLNALKELELDQFKKYMHYYQKFSAHQDEVLRMNYIQFLRKRVEKDLVISEVSELKKITKNGFVLYDLLLIYLDYELDDELTEFFENVDNGTYKIMRNHLPFVIYQKMIHLLKIKDYEEYFRLYESGTTITLSENHKVILEINYYMFQHDLDNLAEAYYKLFRLTDNHNELIKAVEKKLQINHIPDAEFYLDQVQPMLLDAPEYYYMFKAIILKEKTKVKEAFDELDIVFETLKVDINSPFHQFYTAFNMNNNRTDEAVRYMAEYYTKNPNPSWFQVIQHSEDASGEELIKKLEEISGGRRDMSMMNKSFNQGIIGISVYNQLVGSGIEEILFWSHYPFNKIPISKGNVLEMKAKIDFIGSKIIVDTTTLIILASTGGLELLNIFEEILIPYTTMISLNEKKTGHFNVNTNKVIEFIKISPRIKKIPVDETMKIKSKKHRILPEDTYDCLALSSVLNIPFLNSEVAVLAEFNSNVIIDVNALFLCIKERFPKYRESAAHVIVEMRKLGIDFISFDGEDMFNVYKKAGLDGIKPFLKMGRNASYNTFPPAYVSFLKMVFENKHGEYESCCSEIIKFMDGYINKTKYYSSCIAMTYPSLEDSMQELIKNPTVTKILIKKAYYEVIPFNQKAIEAVESLEFKKISSIALAFAMFVFQFASLFSNDKEYKEHNVELLMKNIEVNTEQDIKNILNLMNSVDKKIKGSQS